MEIISNSQSLTDKSMFPPMIQDNDDFSATPITADYDALSSDDDMRRDEALRRYFSESQCDEAARGTWDAEYTGKRDQLPWPRAGGITIINDMEDDACTDEEAYDPVMNIGGFI